MLLEPKEDGSYSKENNIFAQVLLSSVLLVIFNKTKAYKCPIQLLLKYEQNCCWIEWGQTGAPDEGQYNF